MSRSRSVSLEIVPPNTSGGLASVLNAVFKSNSKQNGDDGKGLDDAEADPEEELPAPQSQSNIVKKLSLFYASAAAAVFPPNPCERCVRTKKTCKGVAGARCEYCKRLKQKCSNSTGPARGKHAIPKQPKAAVPSASKPLPISAGGSDLAKWQDRPKRKAPEKPSASQNGNTDDGEGSDDEEDGRDVQLNANKKRRLSKSGPGSGPSRTLLVKTVAEMEASIKRVQSSIAKEVEKMNGLVKGLNAKIKEMDED
ncbi:hypothetical protein BYT27DRAFT_7144503 [Phlegmacium glaucopus]|nr:hypothetical protein BYT27DRAFT_7144503 [Phlegmacium glaucopus]